MALIESNIKKTGLELSDSFIAMGNNDKIFKDFLDAERKAMTIITDLAQSSSTDVAEIHKADLNIVKYISRMEGIMGMQLECEEDTQNEMQDSYNFLGSVFIDLMNLFISNKMKDKGFYITFAKHIFPMGEDTRKVAYDLTMLLMKLMQEQKLDDEFTFNSYSTKRKLTLKLNDRKDLDFAFVIHSVNSTAAGISGIDKSKLKTDELKQLLDMAAKNILEIFNTVLKESKEYSKHHTQIEADVLAFINDQIGVVESISK